MAFQVIVRARYFGKTGIHRDGAPAIARRDAEMRLRPVVISS
jgi:hypothetical protein